MQHPDHLLVEYYDHELNTKHQRQVEEHLAVCPRCRGELERLRQLSNLLADNALPDTFTSPERFRAQVMLKLPRRKAVRNSPVHWAWLAVPASLVCVVALLQSLLAFSGTVRWLVGLAGWSQVDVTLPFAPSLAASGLWGAFGNEIPLSLVGLLGMAWSVFLYLASILILIPYAGWVAVLWRSTTRSWHSGGND